jgi:hypothetical protein
MNAMLIALTRRAGNRRRALGTLGFTALAVAAGSQGSDSTSAKKKSKSDKKQVLKRCKRQVGQCETAIITLCEENADCVAELLPCCASLGRCDGGSIVECVIDAVVLK